MNSLELKLLSAIYIEEYCATKIFLLHTLIEGDITQKDTKVCFLQGYWDSWAIEEVLESRNRFDVLLTDTNRTSNGKPIYMAINEYRKRKQAESDEREAFHQEVLESIQIPPELRSDILF